MLAAGSLRQGQNTLGEAVWNTFGAPFALDFDNGELLQNTIFSLFGIPSDTGLGDNEVLTAPGDSGGPTFVDGKIAAVHSFRATFGKPYDIDAQLNSSFGEIIGDIRVPQVADWIDQTTVPLPGAAYLLLTALGSVLLVGRRWRSDR